MKPVMKNVLSVLKKSKLGLAGAALFVLAATMPAAAKINPIPPNSNAFGTNYSKLSGEWWKWTLGLPATDHPLSFTSDTDPNGEKCAIGQKGKVWFLGGRVALSGSIIRECKVPVGKAIFFPILNTSCTKIEFEPPDGGTFFGANEEQLLDCARNLVTNRTKPDSNLFVEIDGERIEQNEIIKRYRVQSPVVEFNFPDDNIYGLSNPNPGIPICDQTPAEYFETEPEPFIVDGVEVKSPLCQLAADGYHILIPPLSKGDHTIKFGGKFFRPNGTFFELDITYNLKVG